MSWVKFISVLEWICFYLAVLFILAGLLIILGTDGATKGVVFVVFGAVFLLLKVLILPLLKE